MKKIFGQANFLSLLLILIIVLAACNSTSSTEKPTAATNVTATASSDGITVAWEHDGENLTGFNILRETVTSASISSQALEEISTAGASDRSFTDTTVEAGTSYRYSVEAEGEGGTASQTNQTGDAVTALPATPENTAPVANAGADQNVSVGATVSLDGSASTDADSNTLSYNWTLQTPEGSSASLSSSNSATSSFVADVAGVYTASLSVDDGVLSSTASSSDTVTITATPALVITGTLSGAASVPPVETAGTGSFTITLTTDSQGTTLNVTGSYSGLSGPATVAHIHGPASATETAGVILPLVLTAGETAGSGTFAATSPFALQAFTALNNMAYINVHTEANPSGEIRGQISSDAEPPPAPVITGTLSGAASVPPVETAGTGSFTIELVTDANGSTLIVNGTYSSLSGPATVAHIHGPASATETAGVILPLVLTAGETAGSGTFTATAPFTVEQFASLNGMAYINVHTAANPGGEIRGQIQVSP